MTGADGYLFEKRLRGYRAIGYELAEPPAEYGRASDAPVVEWDETALRRLSDPI